jgi:hypothetical protein
MDVLGWSDGRKESCVVARHAERGGIGEHGIHHFHRLVKTARSLRAPQKT